MIMIIGPVPSIPPTRVLPKSPNGNDAVQGRRRHESLDSVSVPQEEFAPLGVGSFTRRGLIGKLATWASRVVPSCQPHLSEEEKHQILDKLQPGDVIMTYVSERPNLGHLEYFATGSHYTHCALYEGHGRIIETLGDQVLRSPLTERLEGPIKVAVVRPPYKTFKDRAQVVKAARRLVGTPYDYKFNNKDSSELYCSEMIEVAMKKVDQSLEVPDVSFFGRELTAPDAFRHMEGARLIHDGQSHYFANQRHQWPMFLGAAVGAGVGALVGGPLGAALGMAVGFEAVLGVVKTAQPEA